MKIISRFKNNIDLNDYVFKHTRAGDVIADGLLKFIRVDSGYVSEIGSFFDITLMTWNEPIIFKRNHELLETLLIEAEKRMQES